MKARLPLLGEPASAPQAPHAIEPAARVRVDRAVIGVSDRDAPELASRFAQQLVETLHARGRRVAALLATSEGRMREGDARRMRAAGAEPALVLAESAMPAAALHELSALAGDCIVVAVGSVFVARLVTLLAVRVSLAPASAIREASAASIDLELGPGMEGSATLIGDWLARHVSEVSMGAAAP